MPRRKKKPAIGGAASSGTPTAQMGVSYPGPNRGSSSIPSSPTQQVVKMRGIDGSEITSFPTFEPLFTGKYHVLGYENLVTSSTFAIPAGWTMANGAVTTQASIIGQSLVDNIARAYANAQGLTLTTPADVMNWSNLWQKAFGTVYGLISMLNADGWNERTTQLASVGNQFRARLASALDRLQDLPIPPGFVDVCRRVYGCFAYDVGDPIVWSYNNTSMSAGTTLDMTLTASWTTLLNNVDSDLALLTTSFEAGPVRIVMAEYYGDPSPLPIDGVKIGRDLLSQFTLMAIKFVGATNTFAWPWANEASVPTGDVTVPVLLPKEALSDPLWLTLYRPQPYAVVNNIVTGSDNNLLGFVFQPIGNTAVRQYLMGSTSSINVVPTAADNGFGTSFSDFYWENLSSASTAANYATDLRAQHGLECFAVPMSYILEQTNQVTNKVYVGKQRFPLPPGVAMYSAERVRSRG